MSKTRTNYIDVGEAGEWMGFGGHAERMGGRGGRVDLRGRVFFNIISFSNYMAFSSLH